MYHCSRCEPWVKGGGHVLIFAPNPVAAYVAVGAPGLPRIFPRIVGWLLAGPENYIPRVENGIFEMLVVPPQDFEVGRYKFL